MYNGPVMYFDRCVCDRYFGETVAASPAKAKSNLAYRYKKENNLVPSSKISLPGEIKEVSNAY
jgi:hypothetical protein